MRTIPAVCTTIVAGILFFPLTALAIDPPLDTPEAFGVALKNWATKYGVQQALVAVRRGGRIVYRSAVGGANPNAAVHLASLSKAITGACTATLIRDGKLAFDTPLSSALGKFFATYGKPADTRLAKVTVEQLLAHRAGFAGNVDHADPVTGPNLVAYLKVNSARQSPKPVLLANAFKVPLRREPGTQYVYSNTAYLVLGAVIEEVTGQPYLSYCRDAVLAPLGVTGEFTPDHHVTQVASSWGVGRQIWFARVFRFCTMAARWNSSRAPERPRKRMRSKRWWVLRCAKRISTFLRSSRDLSKSGVSIRARA
jgi:CubicO group peptidase (beta-lactamase class C family)